MEMPSEEAVTPADGASTSSQVASTESVEMQRVTPAVFTPSLPIAIPSPSESAPSPFDIMREGIKGWKDAGKATSAYPQS